MVLERFGVPPVSSGPTRRTGTPSRRNSRDRAFHVARSPTTGQPVAFVTRLAMSSSSSPPMIMLSANRVGLVSVAGIAPLHPSVQAPAACSCGFPLVFAWGVSTFP